MTHRPIDRRTFLAASAVSTVSLVAGRAPAAGDLGFTLGVQSYTFREFDLEPAPHNGGLATQ